MDVGISLPVRRWMLVMRKDLSSFLGADYDRLPVMVGTEVVDLCGGSEFGGYSIYQKYFSESHLSF